MNDGKIEGDSDAEGIFRLLFKETLIFPQKAQIRADFEVACLNPLRNLRAENFVSRLNQRFLNCVLSVFSRAVR